MFDQTIPGIVVRKFEHFDTLYPGKILPLRNQIKNTLGEGESKLKIFSDYTVDFFADHVLFVLQELGLNLEIETFEIETIQQSILDSSISPQNFLNDVFLIYPNYRQFQSLPYDNEDIIDEVIFKYWQPIWDHLLEIKVPIIFQHNLPFENVVSDLESSKISRINERMKSLAPRNLVWINLEKTSIESKSWFDVKMREVALMPFSLKSASQYRIELLSAFRNGFNLFTKIIITDLDGTLWEGNLAESGVENLVKEIQGTPNLGVNVLPSVLKKFSEDGVLIAISSKNDLSQVREVFQKLNDYPITSANFFAMKVAWSSKSESIREILTESNLSYKNMVFIDNTWEECCEVKDAFPESLVIYIPSFQSKGIDTWILDLMKSSQPLTHEDSLRKHSTGVTSQITNMSNKENLRKFLVDLNMILTIRVATINDVERIRQMHTRTNQFRANTSQFNFNESEIHLVCNLKDEYTEYGLISYIGFDLNEDSLKVKQWLMSCRVFKRDIDVALLSFLAREYLGDLRVFFRIERQDTGKNSFFLERLTQIGFSDDGEMLVSQFSIYEKDVAHSEILKIEIG
jgi:FkbH-like protein